MNTAEEAPEALNIYIMNTQIQQSITEELSPAQIKAKAWYQANKNRYKDVWKARYQVNKDKVKAKSKARYELNKDYYKINYKINKEQKKALNKIYFQKNKKRIYKQRQQKAKTNMLFKFKCTLRSHSSRAFKRIGQSKPTKTEHLIGCTWLEAKEHIEKLFQPGMTWDNHGKWHIDHIIPIASSKTIEEAIKLNHITNLQPLWAKDNLTKGARVGGG